MLTTVQGEQHSLGFLMVEALLRIGGAEVIAFGTEMPIRGIRQAALSYKIDIIGLSFSCSFKTDDAIVMLSGLRQMIDPEIRIWVERRLIPAHLCLKGWDYSMDFTSWNELLEIGNATLQATNSRCYILATAVVLADF